MRALLFLAIACASLLLGACGATEQQSVVVTLRSAADDAPVAGVAVKVTTLNPQHALRYTDYTRWIGGGPAADAPARLTDAQGQATLPAPLDRPFLIQLLLPGLQPETIYLRENDHEPRFEGTDWIEVPIGKPEAARKWRVRVEAGN